MQGKKSFILYTDLLPTVSLLSDEKAGQLFKLILEYVNDKNPSTDDMLLQVAFEPIKQNLKRDLVKWFDFINKQKVNGSKGGRPKKKHNPTKPKKPKPSLKNPKNPMNVNVNVNDSVTVSVKKKEGAPPSLDEVKKYFADNGFTNAEKAYQFYDDKDWFDSRGNKVMNWKSKMKRVWFKDENKISEKKIHVMNPFGEKVWMTESKFNNHPQKSSYKIL